LSEHRIGHVLRQQPRDSFVISTKVGRTLKPKEPNSFFVHSLWGNTLPFEAVYDYSYDGVMRQVEDSLQRLATHRIDILHIHNVDIVEFGSQAETERRFFEAMSGAYRALKKLRAEGTVKAIGCGLDDWEACVRFAEVGDFDCFVLAGRYTLLEQAALDKFLPLCQERNIAILLGGVYNSGILATGVKEGARYEYDKAPPEIIEKVRLIETICNRYQVSIAAAAIQFPLAHPAIASVVIGVATPEEVKQNAELMQVEIPPELWQDLKASGVLREDAPTP
jgi:D-threo-aldose 1-dehydrogenase